MTWGQLRFQLQTSAPDVALDLLDEYLTNRYQTVLSATDWTGLKAHATIQTTAAYQSVLDTVTLTVGSAAVVGLATGWAPAITGLRFYRPGDTVIYTATQLSGTSLLLDRPYEGTGDIPAGTVYAATAYVLMQNVYALPTDCRSIDSVLNPVTGRPMRPFSKDELDRSVGTRCLIDNPDAYAAYSDTPEASPPVLQQIEFYPPPVSARGLPLEYVRNATLFDGQTTSVSPLPFVSSAVLLAGARADAAMHQEKFSKAEGYAAQFELELARLLKVEFQQKRTKQPLQMASRFTRHRMARAARGYQGGFGPNPPTSAP